MVHHIKKGLDLPISGIPAQKIVNSNTIRKVALLGSDYIGMKPTMLVQEGERVKIGQPLFSCKKTEGVIYTSPGAGTISAITRGEKRVFQSIEIELDGDEHVSFENYREKAVADLTDTEVENLLVESGLWTSLRTRPFSKVPTPGTRPKSIFVNVMDTNPLSPNPEVILNDYSEDFQNGLTVLSKICGENLWIAKAEHHSLETPDQERVRVESFKGPHPSGTVGLHIHTLDPVFPGKEVWHLGYQDVVAIGRLFVTGRLFLERIISLAGPEVYSPRLIRTRIGASLDDLTRNQLKNSNQLRIISGSVFNGRQRCNVFKYLGRYHQQVTVLAEGRDREFLGWQGPGKDKFSVKNTYVGKFAQKVFSFTTNLQGSSRAIVPVGSFESVMPFDILPTMLLRALSTSDTDSSQELGCLELDEEDLALCTFVSPGKEDFGPLLRNHLTTIEKEG